MTESQKDQAQTVGRIKSVSRGKLGLSRCVLTAENPAMIFVDWDDECCFDFPSAAQDWADITKP